MPTMPLNPNCPFEREEGDGCYNGTFDGAGNFTGNGGAFTTTLKWGVLVNE